MREARSGCCSLRLTRGIAIGLSSCGSSSGKEGGTLTGSYASFPELDPALSYDQEGWTAMYDTYLPLLTYNARQRRGRRRSRPGLAESLPKITNGGKTYTLTLRKGLKYSDGTPVKASDFAPRSNGCSRSTLRLALLRRHRRRRRVRQNEEGGISGIKTDDKTGKIEIELTSRAEPSPTSWRCCSSPCCPPTRRQRT